MKTIKLGLIGCGVVGSGLIDLLSRRAKLIEQRVGAPVEIVKVAVRDMAKPRSVAIDKTLLTDDPFTVVDSPKVDIIVELMGGADTAKQIALCSAKNGKHIVTANKHLLAIHGMEIYKAVEEAKVELGFEAAVAGAIPIIHSLKNVFAGDIIESVHGIINGTSNYILSQMADSGASFSFALSQAQQLGFAEADPTLDVGGVDSAHKIAILSALVFETQVPFSAIYTEGITSITTQDVMMAKEFGYRIKSLAIAKRVDDRIDIRVHPAMTPVSSPIANVNGALNAVELKGESAGMNMLVGPGAGAGPTASAVMGDIIRIARKVLNGGAGKTPPLNVPSGSLQKIAIRPMDEITTEYYLRFTVEDKPGVLAMIASALGDNGVSIASMIQRGIERSKPVSVVLMTHTAREESLNLALEKIKGLNICEAPTAAIRIENEENQIG